MRKPFVLLGSMTGSALLPVATLASAAAAGVPASARALTWSVVPSPNPVAGSNAFNAVSCAGEDACTAVGASGNSSGRPGRALIETGTAGP